MRRAVSSIALRSMIAPVEAFMLDILLGIWQIGNMAIELALRALANDKRLQILGWLRDPRAHFPPQVDGDLVKDGVCGLFIAEKLGVSQPTASEHLKVLTQPASCAASASSSGRFISATKKRSRKSNARSL